MFDGLYFLLGMSESGSAERQMQSLGALIDGGVGPGSNSCSCRCRSRRQRATHAPLDAPPRPTRDTVTCPRSKPQLTLSRHPRARSLNFACGARRHSEIYVRNR